MTAENLGRLLGLFAQRCRLPAAAVEEEDAACGEDEEGEGQKKRKAKGGEKEGRGSMGGIQRRGPLCMSAASPKHLLVLPQLNEHITSTHTHTEEDLISNAAS